LTTASEHEPTMTEVDPEAVAARVHAVRERIARAGGRDVRLVAVTKGFGVDAVAAALAAGVDDVGENYAQEMLGKLGTLDDDAQPRWHFLGRLQRNKVKALAPHVHLWQSVDTASLGVEIAKRRPGASVLVQVNLSGEVQKGGCAFDEVIDLVSQLRDEGLAVLGLMGVGPAGPPEDARPAFRRLVDLADEVGLVERSIGMTDDLEVAVEEGSTMVRIGRDLFGPRPPRSR
jgi:pyridoxal phosphate enzyme (YggS family)